MGRLKTVTVGGQAATWVKVKHITWIDYEVRIGGITLQARESDYMLWADNHIEPCLIPCPKPRLRLTEIIRDIDEEDEIDPWLNYYL